jgi:peptide/nickel transport system permease protein
VVAGGAVVTGATIFGLAAGLLAGWNGGWWDETLMRITDMFLAFPRLILAMAISAILRPNLTNALLAITVTSWPVYARIVRAQVLTLRGREHMEAARAEGATDTAMLARHLVPNAAPCGHSFLAIPFNCVPTHFSGTHLAPERSLPSGE